MASQHRALLSKEAAVGIGAGMTVLLMRILPAPMAALTLGSVGLACILIGYALVAAAGSEDTDSRRGRTSLRLQLPSAPEPQLTAPGISADSPTS